VRKTLNRETVIPPIAVNYPGSTEFESAAGFMCTMEYAPEAGSDLLARYSPSRRSDVAGARNAVEAGDEQRREKNPLLPLCAAETRKAAKKITQWAVGIAQEAGTAVGAHLRCQGA